MPIKIDPSSIPRTYRDYLKKMVNGRADGLQKSKHLVYTLSLPVILPVC